MKAYYSILSLLLLALATFSCEDSPEFSNTPKIEYNNIIFKDLGDNDADSLIISVDFEDGDGDLGLGTQELAPPFNQKNYFSNKTGDFFNFNTETFEDILKLSDRATIDSLPDYIGDATCLRWDTNPDLFFSDGTQVEDTLYFRFNDRHHNILIDFYVDRGNGFEFFDWRVRNSCLTLDGRFPILNAENDERALEGTIRYGMTSFGFRSIFGDDLIKLEVTVIDRAGNFSQPIETPPFRLSEID